MTIEQFDQALRDAAKGANFGPLNGFGGTGSGTVYEALPEPIRKVLFNRWKIPRAILANWNPGQSIRHFAEACGRPVAADIEALSL